MCLVRANNFTCQNILINYSSFYVANTKVKQKNRQHFFIQFLAHEFKFWISTPFLNCQCARTGTTIINYLFIRRITKKRDKLSESNRRIILFLFLPVCMIELIYSLQPVYR